MAGRGPTLEKMDEKWTKDGGRAGSKVEKSPRQRMVNKETGSGCRHRLI